MYHFLNDPLIKFKPSKGLIEQSNAFAETVVKEFETLTGKPFIERLNDEIKRIDDNLAKGPEGFTNAFRWTSLNLREACATKLRELGYVVKYNPVQVRINVEQP